MDKQIRKPEWRRFSDLFTGARPWSSENQSRPLMRLESDIYQNSYRRGRDRMTVTGYCAVLGPPGHRSLEVTGLTPELQELLKNLVGVIDNDAMHFEIIWRGDTALVTANHNRIIGNYWLAEIDPTTVPRFG